MSTIIFTCIFYAIFAALFMYGVFIKGADSTPIKITFTILSILFGWILLPIYLGRKLN